MSTSSLASCASDGACSASTGVSSSYVSVTKEIFFDKCPRCRVQFDFLKRTNNVSSKLPLILNCKHTVCEDCIRKMCITNVTICPVCREKFSITRTQFDALTEVFTPHYSLIGYLLWTKNSPSKGHGHINFVSTGVTLKNKQTFGTDSIEINSVIEAEKSDEDFEETEIEKPTISLEFDKCPEHVDTYVNIECENCNCRVCCYCFVENHGGHKAIYLYKLNDTEVSDVQQLKSELEIILRQLQLSQKKTKQLKTFDLTNVESDIKSCFTNLHAKLHLAEQNVKKRLQSFKLDETDLGVINSTLKSGVYRVSQILNVLNTTNPKQINVRGLYDEVQELKKIPCRLVSDHGTLDPLEFLSRGDFLDDIDDYFVLKKPMGLEYTLLPIEDWSNCQIEDSEVSAPKVEDVLIPKENKEKVNKEVHKKKNEVVSSRSKTRESANEGPKVKVNLTHLNDLNSFYVQKCSVQSDLRNMNKHIGQKTKKKLHADDIVKGRVYGVYYETRHSGYWRRGKVMDVVRKEPNDCLYSMFFIDYGNTQYVTIDKLKDLDYFIIKKPPFAFECKLFNPDNTVFEANAHLHLPQIIGEKDLYLQFTKRQIGVQEVDLLVPSSNGSLISVRNILTKNVPIVPEREDLILPKNLKLFKNSKKFAVGQEEHVMITHVEDPFHIYIQLNQNLDALEKMRKEMKLFYEQHRSVSCIPVEDSDVVIKYEHEFQGNWHRGTIVSVDAENQLVDVIFVDWGGFATVPWSSIKLLTENFTKIEQQALCVKLADIEKEVVDEPWPQKTIDFIKEQVLIDNKFRMMVNHLDPLEVALFQIRPSADVCLNTLLVKNQLAISTGNISETLYWPKDPEDEKVEEDNDEFSYQLIKKSEEVLAEDEDSELKDGLRQQVTVVHFESPDLIYVRFAKYKEMEEEMHKELHIHYSSRRKTQDSWQPSEYCVVYDAARKNYFRGVIKKSCGPSAYLVYLYDYVRELKVPKNQIFVLEQYFKRFACYVFKCRLANIKPAGDRGEWSQLAIEMLQKIFATYKIIHIKKVEANEKLKMLGVIMWYSLTKPAKALEPAKLNFISINKSLIEGGVAFSSMPSTTCNNEGGATAASAESRPSPSENKKDWYELICEDEEVLKGASTSCPEPLPLKSALTTWPAPLPLQNAEFDAVLTCVDLEGIFSLRDDEMHAMYLDLEEKINAMFHSMELPREQTAEWRPNEMCTILYDNVFYRGTVTDVVDAEEVTVEMIDFGSEHTVSKKQVFKKFMYTEIPPLINKVQLYDVYSKFGQWSATDVDDLLQITTENIRVVIKSSLSDDLPAAEIYLPNGLSLNDLIVQKCPHLYRRENRVALGNLETTEDDEESYGGEGEEVATMDGDDSFQQEDSEDNVDESGVLTYTYAPFPESPKLKMAVISFLKFGTDYNVVLNFLNEDKKASALDDLNVLNKDIQTHVEELPAMEGIEVNDACVGFYVQKGMWCRALIYDTDSLDFGYVLAFFVDYGTVDMVTVENLKVMKPEWFNLPVYNRIAILDIELVRSERAEHVLMQMNNLRGKFVTVKITSKDPLRVHLYEGKNLCYQNLINCGIVKAI